MIRAGSDENIRMRVRIRGWVHLFPIILLLMAMWGCSGVSPASAPAPLAEIPSAMQIPADLSVGGSGNLTGGGLNFVKALAAGIKLLTNNEIREGIEGSAEILEFSNKILDAALVPISQSTIPVDPARTTFETSIAVEDLTFSIKMDFGIFDLNNDGIGESCSGCTCPTGCTADGLTVCPTVAPVAELKPICVRVWLNNKRYVAGVFDRVPTADNPESGEIRFLFSEFGDLAGTNASINYDHSDPLSEITDFALFMKDVEDGDDPNEPFFQRRRSIASQIGEPAQAKVDVKLSAEEFPLIIDGKPVPSSDGLLQYQAKSFNHLDIMDLELIVNGVFSYLPNITPPVCAKITTGDQLPDSDCSDLDLDLTAGDFVALPTLEEVLIPPLTQFPATPTF